MRGSDIMGVFGMAEMEVAAARVYDLRERDSLRPNGSLDAQAADEITGSPGFPPTDFVLDDFKMFGLPKGAVSLRDMRPAEWGEEVGFLHLLCGGWLRPASVCSKRYFVPTDAFWERLREKGKV